MRLTRYAHSRELADRILVLVLTRFLKNNTSQEYGDDWKQMPPSLAALFFESPTSPMGLDTGDVRAPTSAAARAALSRVSRGLFLPIRHVISRRRASQLPAYELERLGGAGDRSVDREPTFAVSRNFDASEVALGKAPTRIGSADCDLEAGPHIPFIVDGQIQSPGTDSTVVDK